MDFCNNNGFFAKWQRTKLTDKYTGNPLKGCWSIGIFEIDNYLENVEKWNDPKLVDTFLFS